MDFFSIFEGILDELREVFISELVINSELLTQFRFAYSTAWDHCTSLVNSLGYLLSKETKVSLETLEGLPIRHRILRHATFEKKKKDQMSRVYVSLNIFKDQVLCVMKQKHCNFCLCSIFLKIEDQKANREKTIRWRICLDPIMEYEERLVPSLEELQEEITHFESGVFSSI